jgi:DNA-binding transcriptional MerR regulator
MLIGEIVNKTGLSKDTIRFYEKHGLISVSRKERRANNYKEYSDETLEKLLTIKLLKSFGFTLNECMEILDLIAINKATCNNLSSKIDEKVNLLDEKITELIRIRTLLLEGASKCKGGCNPSRPDENCPIIVMKTC